MGDLQVCYTNATGSNVSREDRHCPSLPFSSSSSSDSPDHSCSIAKESWERAEEITRRIIWSVQPTLGADSNRKEVIEYVQGLIKDGLGYQVFPYGSVPLKTYLPDGDIDLTTLSSPPVVDTLVSDVYAILRDEEHNPTAPYEVKDVHCIDAEVKLVKCLVQNIVLDISFNQLGGLCTLCFLEQVDRLVGKDHLFKRSVILIKAWCYYESHILGALHGLISTYALETLILYVFHFFHSSLDGPLAVLYRFLDYFSNFDWENYCISLNGPVCKTSLSDIVAEVPANMGNGPLLTEEFLKKCINMFSVPSRGVETNSQLFPLKYLNIIDPLKENNNLGRSVNKGNYYRIRSALKYGARKLGRILTLPREGIEGELVSFFANTLERHGSNHLKYVQNILPTSDAMGSDHVIPDACASRSLENNLLAKSMDVGSTNNKILGSIAASGSRYKLRCPFNTSSLQRPPERKTNANENVFSGYFHPGDAKQFVASGLLANRSKRSSDHCSLSSKLGASLPTNCLVNKQNGRIKNGNYSKSMLTHSIAAYGMTFAPKPHLKKNTSAASNEVCKKELASFFAESDFLKSLLDLSGDFDDHFLSVLYGQYCHLFSVSTPFLPSPPLFPHSQNENLWETFEQSIQLKHDFYSPKYSNDILGSQICFSKSFDADFPAFGLEDEKKRRTGTSIVNTKYHNPERLSTRRNFQAARAHGQSQRYTNSNGSATVQQEMTLSQEGNRELSLDEYPALGNVKIGSDTYQPYKSAWFSSANNGLSWQPERIESGSCGLELQRIDMSVDNDLPESSTSRVISPRDTMPAAQGTKPPVELNEESDAGQSYYLKDEQDFPPLSAWKGCLKQKV